MSLTGGANARAQKNGSQAALMVPGDGRQLGSAAGRQLSGTSKKRSRNAADAAVRRLATAVDFERRSCASETRGAVVACVDLQPAAPTGGRLVSPDTLRQLAVKRMERCVRPYDRMCMLGGSRLAVLFGNGAHRITPTALGTRLARAMGSHLVVGASELPLQVSVSVCTGAAATQSTELTGMAIATARPYGRAGAASRPEGPVTQQSVITVTTVPGPDEFLTVRPMSVGVTQTPDAGSTVSHPSRLARRTLVLLVVDGSSRRDARGPDRVPIPSGVALARSIPAELAARILVVDLDADLDDRLRPALQGVLAVIRTAGAFPLVSVADDVKAVVADMVLTEADAVLLALHPESQPCARGDTTLWEVAARITRVLVLEDHHVIALGVGASAAAVAACVENGAIGVLEIDALPEAILSLTKSLNGTANGEDPGRVAGGRNGHRGHRTLPAPYDALVRLTSSERKVLFQMMEGHSATDIATSLMVSLSTVRSHIRAILRKLNVNSQLAAVAVANGVRFGLNPPT